MKHILVAFAALLFCILLSFGFLITKSITTAQKIQVDGNTVAAPTLAQKLKTLQAVLLPGEQVPLRGEERNRINILLLGKAGEGLPGGHLTDTIMLASIQPKTKKVALLSLPRDLYISESENGDTGKINTFYQKGLSRNDPMGPMKEAVTLITGEPIDYFFVMNFEGFESLVDALGGVHVDVPKDFYDARYPGKNYSYEVFELKKGWQQLDGKTALKYVRERHDDPEGDFGRAKRQQQVLQALKNKGSSPGVYLNFFRVNKIFESIGDNVETDATLAEMQSFYELSKSLDTQNITNRVVDAWKPESLLRVDHPTLGGVRAFALTPRTGTWEETRELAKNIFETDVIRAKREAITKEEATVTILTSNATFSGASKLATYIERELGMTTSVITTSELERQSQPAMLIASGELKKPYSFEELLKRLPITRGSNLPTGITEKQKADFILIMDKRLGDIFQRSDEYYDENVAPEEGYSDFPSS